MLNIENLYFKYGQQFSLLVDKLTLPEDQILGIIGPNGAGKTTLLNLIALFETPQAGQISFDGKNIREIEKNSYRRQMSFVFSKPYLLNMSVQDNVNLPLRLRGVANPEYIKELLEFFEIDHLRNHNAKSLSQGQGHRTALARALVTKPRLLLLDEPFLSLDQKYKEEILYDLRAIIKKNKITTLLVSQDHFEIISLADRVMFMKEGRIMQQGNTDDIFVRPASKEIADFVGVETILEGVIIKKEENLCFVRTHNMLFEVASELKPFDHVFICLRPEDIILSKVLSHSSVRNNFKARIREINKWRLGYKVMVNCGFDTVALVTKQSLEEMDWKIGDEVVVSFKATAAHLVKR